MNGRKLLDLLADANVVVKEEGHLEPNDCMYWIDAKGGFFKEVDSIDIAKELLEFFECDYVKVWLKEEKDDEDTDQLGFYYHAAKVHTDEKEE